MRKIFGMFIAGTAVAAATAGAQVGYPPAQSPFREVEQRHEITAFGGYFSAKRDPAGVAPQGGGMAGLLYEWRASGPINLGGSFIMVNSSRTELDPAKPVTTRDLGTKSQTLYAGEAFMAVALTGERSWRSLVPMTSVGLGLISNGEQADVGGFRFGTRFAFPWSVGIRFVPGGAFQLRADIKDWMYTIKYPQGYYTASASGGTAIVPPNISTSRWTNNFAMTVGGSFTFKR